MSATHALRPGEAIPGPAPRAHGGVWHVYRAERRKLSTQLSTRLLALFCILGPFAFAGVLKIQTGSPADTLFGVWVHQSGLALSLVVLSFCGSWGFPVLAGVLCGDIFASEDRYGTWKMVLTRSSTRRDLFAGKLLAAFTFSIGLLVLLAISSLAAGLLLIGDGALVDLSGRTLSTGHGLVLVLVAWLLNVLPMLAFTSLAVLLSIATRNGIVGVVGPALIDLVMQLLLLVGSGVWLHLLLASSAFQDWYALFTSHPYFGPLVDRVHRQRDLDRRLIWPGRGCSSAGATTPARRSAAVRAGWCRSASRSGRPRWSRSWPSRATGARPATPPRG